MDPWLSGADGSILCFPNCLEKNGTLIEIYSIRINKSYKDRGDNEWKSTDNLAAEDLLKVAVVAKEAYKFIRVRESEPINQLPSSRVDEVE